jgi:hypothetical protein
MMVRAAAAFRRTAPARRRERTGYVELKTVPARVRKRCISIRQGRRQGRAVTVLRQPVGTMKLRRQRRRQAAACQVVVRKNHHDRHGLAAERPALSVRARSAARGAAIGTAWGKITSSDDEFSAAFGAGGPARRHGLGLV